MREVDDIHCFRPQNGLQAAICGPELQLVRTIFDDVIVAQPLGGAAGQEGGTGFDGFSDAAGGAPAETPRPTQLVFL